jgi:hypothetical protein
VAFKPAEPLVSRLKCVLSGPCVAEHVPAAGESQAAARERSAAPAVLVQLLIGSARSGLVLSWCGR